MEGFILLFTMAMTITAYIAAQIYNTFRDIKEAAYIYKNPISKPRLYFLHHVFGLSREDCDAFRFDGFNFNFIKGKIHYKNVTFIECLRSKTVNIRNDDLPHRRRWLYQRVDGGPDRRYSVNYIVRISTILSLKVYKSDGSSFKTKVYSSPELNIRATIKKFNIFLEVMKRNNFELYYQEFKKYYVAVQRNKIDIARLQKQEQILRNQIDILYLLRDLKKQNLSNLKPDHYTRLKLLESEKEKCTNEILRLEQELLSQENDLKKLLKIAKAELALLLNGNTTGPFTYISRNVT